MKVSCLRRWSLAFFNWPTSAQPTVCIAHAIAGLVAPRNYHKTHSITATHSLETHTDTSHTHWLCVSLQRFIQLRAHSLLNGNEHHTHHGVRVIHSTFTLLLLSFIHLSQYWFQSAFHCTGLLSLRNWMNLHDLPNLEVIQPKRSRNMFNVFFKILLKPPSKPTIHLTAIIKVNLR